MNKDKDRNKYYNQYLKVKKKYNLFNNNKISYKFVYFTKLEQQKTFIKEREKEVIQILKGCIPLNRDVLDKEDVTLYTEHIRNMLRMYAYSGDSYKWYFNTVNNKIASLCFIGQKIHMYKTDDKLKTYTLYRTDKCNKYDEGCELISEKSLSKVQNNVVSKGPVIYSLCKDPSFKNAGRDLLNNVFRLYKSKYIYLIQESILFKDNYADIFGVDSCRFMDVKRYKEANDKLTNYYKSPAINMKRLKNFYDIYYCYSDQHDVVHYMFFKVFYKKLY